MNFDLHIENIGKLTDATIRIGRFTVFAGPNNTGKSFVSKFLYSILDVMNSTSVGHQIGGHWGYFVSIEPILDYIERGENPKQNTEEIRKLRKEILRLKSIIEYAPLADPRKMDGYLADIKIGIRDIKEMLPDVRSSIEPWANKIALNDFSALEPIFNLLERQLDDATGLINSVIRERITESLIANFQVEKLSDLRGTKDIPAKFESGEFGKFEIENGEMDCTITSARLPEFSNLIYLESPVYSKLKTALESIRFDSSRRDEKRLSGVPEYFYNLVDALRSRYKGDIVFPEVYERLTGKDVLGGKIEISGLGELRFQENDRSFPMSATATGTANLGILALLIERKILGKNSVIFIDEPEAHLHPAWQVEMAEALFDLAKGGANVVIATHSADILKWLEVHVKNNPDDEKLVALNKFPVNGDATNEQNFSDKIADIKQELTKPFADLYVAGL